MNHPTDVDYIKKMVPNISDEIVEKQKSLQSGTCLGFGSAFRIPLIVKLKMPNPMPMSGNCDVVRIWDGHSSEQTENTEIKNIENKQNQNPSTINNIASTGIKVENNIENEESKITNMPTQNSTNVGIPEIDSSALGITSNDVTLANNEQINSIPTIPEEEHKETFNIGIDNTNNISNQSINNLNKSVQDKTTSITPIPEININNTETL